MQIRILIILSIVCIYPSSAHVSSIKFTGNTLDKSQLLLILKHKKPSLFSRSELNSKLLSIDAMLIESYYKSIGFIDASVDAEVIEIDDMNVSINFLINEGNRYRLNDISFNGNSYFPDSVLSDLISENITSYYEPPTISSNIDNLYLLYQRNGMIYSSILPKEIINDDTVDLELDIVEGEVYNIANVNIDTNGRERYVSRELEFQAEDMYNIDNINLSRKQIYATRLFSSIDISHSISKSDSLAVDIVIKTKDLKPILRELNFGISQLSTAKNDIVKPAFSSQLEWKNNNIFDSSYQLGIKADIALNYYQDAKDDIFLRMYCNIDFQGKWIWRYRVPFRLMYYREYISDIVSIDRYGFKTDFTILKNKNINSVLVFTHESSDSEESTNINKNNSLEILFDYNDVDDYLNPSRGSYIRINPSLHGTVIGGDFNYIKLLSDFRHYLHLGAGTTLAARLQYGAIINLSNLLSSIESTNENPPSYDLFYIGGQPTLRGWDSIADLCDCNIDEGEGGEKYKLLFNIEVRKKLYKKLGSQLFFDCGETSSDNTFFNNIKWNVGYGFSYMTPVGPITFNVGYPYGKNNPTFHFSFLYMF